MWVSVTWVMVMPFLAARSRYTWMSRRGSTTIASFFAWQPIT